MKLECPIPLSKLGDWVFDTATGWHDDELPIYRLVPPRELRGSDTVIANFRDAGLTAERRTDSGTVEARTATPDVSLDTSGPFAQAVLRACVSEDRRTYRPAFDDVDSSTTRQFASYRSRIEPIDAPDSDVPVIGPGGGISMFRTETAVRVDFTVRKRLGELSSRWRALRKLYRPYEQEFAPWKKYVEVEPMFGYFELSKYEPQLVLRPAFVFIFSIRGGDDAVSWQTVRVEPATVSKGISLRTGLGQWQSSGGAQ